MRITVIVLISLMLTSCEGSTVEFDESNLLLGNWSLETSKNGTITFNRTTDLPDSKYGVAFKQEGLYQERTSGWCATPPLSFFTTEGSYDANNEVIYIYMNNDLYPTQIKWKIITLDKNKLVVKRTQSDQEKDYEVLLNYFKEITAFLDGMNCSNASDWSFIAYGAKACGGPQGYIAYPNSIDVKAFLEKIEIYTNMEKEYNTKWNISSDCWMVPTPSEIICENGKPKIIY